MLRAIQTTAEVEAGISIGKASLGAVELALKTETNVEFNFNGHTYRVLFKDIYLLARKVEVEKVDNTVFDGA